MDGKRWTKDKEDFLVANYQRLSFKELSEALERSIEQNNRREPSSKILAPELQPKATASLYIYGLNLIRSLF